MSRISVHSLSKEAKHCFLQRLVKLEDLGVSLSIVQNSFQSNRNGIGAQSHLGSFPWKMQQVRSKAHQPNKMFFADSQ